MKNIREFDEEPKHQNWLKCVMALKNLQKLLKPFIDDEIEIFYGELGNQCGRDHCVKECDLRNSNPRSNQIPPLGCKVCPRWRDVILTNTSQHGKLCWVNSKPHLWSTEKWEVAKVYMPNGHKNHNSVGDFDIAAFLRLMIQCKHFEKFELGDSCNNVSNVRNDIMHAPSYQLEKEDLQDCFSRIRELGEKLAKHVPEFKSLSKDIDEILNLEYRLILPDDMAAQEILKSQLEKALEDLLFSAVQVVALMSKVETLEKRNSEHHKKMTALRRFYRTNLKRMNKQVTEFRRIIGNMRKIYTLLVFGATIVLIMMLVIARWH